jgi:glyceraldehyde-3-phosphate dehydrogenase/erythrose-4-phosphate dehydrogenase
VIFTAPAKDKSPTFVMGVNHDKYTPDMTYVSCARYCVCVLVCMCVGVRSYTFVNVSCV